MAVENQNASDFLLLRYIQYSIHTSLIESLFSNATRVINTQELQNMCLYPK